MTTVFASGHVLEGEHNRAGRTGQPGRQGAQYVTPQANVRLRPRDELLVQGARDKVRRILAKVSGLSIPGDRGRRQVTLSLGAAVASDSLADLTPETLIAAALDGPAPARILDLGTGSGCILLTLLAEWPDARGVGVDLSAAALAVARANAAALGLADRAAAEVK